MSKRSRSKLHRVVQSSATPAPLSSWLANDAILKHLNRSTKTRMRNITRKKKIHLHLNEPATTCLKDKLNQPSTRTTFARLFLLELAVLRAQRFCRIQYHESVLPIFLRWSIPRNVRGCRFKSYCTQHILSFYLFFFLINGYVCT